MGCNQRGGPDHTTEAPVARSLDRAAQGDGAGRSRIEACFWEGSRHVDRRISGCWTQPFHRPHSLMVHKVHRDTHLRFSLHENTSETQTARPEIQKRSEPELSRKFPARTYCVASHEERHLQRLEALLSCLQTRQPCFRYNIWSAAESPACARSRMEDEAS